MYLFSVVLAFVLNILSSLLLMIRVNDEGIIFKSHKKGLSLGDIVFFCLRFVPYINIALGALIMSLSLFIVSHEEAWKEFVNNFQKIPEWVIKQFEINNVPGDVLKDNLKLDGAEYLEKSKEITNFILYQSNWLKGDKYSCSGPDFTKSDYIKAKSVVASEQMLYEILCNVSLNENQKINILKLLRKEFAKDIKNPEILETKEDYVPEDLEDNLVAIGYNNNLVEREVEVLDTLDDNEVVQKILKIIG